MISTLRKKGQITIPNEIIKKMKLQEKENLDFQIVNNKIVITPVEIVEAKFMEEVREEHEHYLKTKGEGYKKYTNTDDFMKDI